MTTDSPVVNPVTGLTLTSASYSVVLSSMMLVHSTTLKLERTAICGQWQNIWAAHAYENRDTTRRQSRAKTSQDLGVLLQDCGLQLCPQIPRTSKSGRSERSKPRYSAGPLFFSASASKSFTSFRRVRLNREVTSDINFPSSERDWRVKHARVLERAYLK